jgi:hypothetical protein
MCKMRECGLCFLNLVRLSKRQKEFWIISHDQIV